MNKPKWTQSFFLQVFENSSQEHELLTISSGHMISQQPLLSLTYFRAQLHCLSYSGVWNQACLLQLSYYAIFWQTDSAQDSSDISSSMM